MNEEMMIQHLMANVNVATCSSCGRATVLPQSDKCRHCGAELSPISLNVPADAIVAIVVDPAFAREHPDHALTTEE